MIQSRDWKDGRCYVCGEQPVFKLRTLTTVTCMGPAHIAGPVSPLAVLTCITHGCLPGEGVRKGILNAKIAVHICLKFFTLLLYSQENCWVSRDQRDWRRSSVPRTAASELMLPWFTPPLLLWSALVPSETRKQTYSPVSRHQKAYVKHALTKHFFLEDSSPTAWGLF